MRRMNPHDRRETLIKTALHLSLKIGYQALSRYNIADAAGVAHSLVWYYLGNTEAMKKTILQAAIDRELVDIVAQGLAMRDPVACNAPQKLKKKTIRYLSTF